jgi:putative membrane protein
LTVDNPEGSDPKHGSLFKPLFLARVLFGGGLMGVANIIPGVSGGTMILATGLYEDFVDAIADTTRLKLRVRNLAFLAAMGVAAVVAIFLAVDLINWGLTNHQHIMFALFIGLTVGGVPLIGRSITPVKPGGIAGAVAGLAAILTITFALQQVDLPANFAFLFVGGIIGSAAMVLPGISGSYLLLVMGLYFPITEGISAFKAALNAADIGAAMDPAFGVILPVGLGVLVGIVGLTNLLKALLRRAHDLTMGTLLGLLLGSVFFLYPFKAPGHKDPFESAAPITAANLAVVAGAIVAGFAVTYGLAQLEKKSSPGDTK